MRDDDTYRDGCHCIPPVDAERINWSTGSYRPPRNIMHDAQKYGRRLERDPSKMDLKVLHRKLLERSRGYHDDLEYLLPAPPSLVRRAIHEAGHAVTAAALGLRVPIATIESLESHVEGTVFVRNWHSAEDRAVILAAGRAAEERFLVDGYGWNSDRAGSHLDFAEIETLNLTNVQLRKCGKRTWTLLGEHAVFLKYLAQRLLLHRTVFRVEELLAFWVRKHFRPIRCTECPSRHVVASEFMRGEREKLHCPSCGSAMVVEGALKPPFEKRLLPPWRAKPRNKAS